MLWVEVTRNITILLQQSHTTFIKHSRRLSSLKDCILIYIKAFQCDINEDRNAWVTNHTVGFVTHKVPYWQLTLLLIDAKHCLSNVALLLWVNDCHQWMCCTIGVPKWESSIICKVTLIGLAVCTTIFTVYIIEDRRCNHRVIQCCIEYLSCTLVLCLDSNLTQLTVPLVLCLSNSIAEVPTWKFLLHIQSSVLNTHCRDSYLHKKWLLGIVESKDTDCITLVWLQLNRLWELCHKVNALVFSPSLWHTVATDGLSRLLLETARSHLVPTDTLWEVQNNVTLCCISRESVTMEGYTLGGSQLYTNTRSQHHRVVTRGYMLGTMGKLHLTLCWIGSREEWYITQVTNTRTAKVHLSESDDCWIAVMITRTPVPALLLLCRTSLNVTEWNISSKEHMSVSACSNKWVNILRIVLRKSEKTGCSKRH